MKRADLFCIHTLSRQKDCARAHQQKNTGLRNVLLLSTVQPILGVIKNPKKKPAIYKLYDYTKGGTDIIDQRVGTYSCYTKSRRWTMAAFSHVLDTCRVNASTVFALNKGQDPRKQKSFNFVLDLASELILPQIKERRLTGLKSTTRDS